MGKLTLTTIPGPASPQHHRAHLEEAVALWGFHGFCGELRSWMENQTALLQALQPQAHNLEVTQLAYEVLPTKGGGSHLLSPAASPYSLSFFLPARSRLSVICSCA